MKPVSLALLGVLSLVACKDRPVALEPAAADAAVEPVPEGWALTLAKLDGYLGYQRALLVQAGALAAPRWDGGLQHYFAPTVEENADFDERARQQARLSVEDVERIEAMTAAIAGRRLSARFTHALDPPPGIAPGPRGQGGALTEDRAPRASANLSPERELFGSQNVDLLLQREEELLRNWAALMGLPPKDEKRGKP